MVYILLLKIKNFNSIYKQLSLVNKKTSMKKEKWPKVCIGINNNCMEKVVMLIVATMILHVPNTKIELHGIKYIP